MAIPILEYCKDCGKSFSDVERGVRNSHQPKGFIEFNFCKTCFRKKKKKENRKYYQREKNGKFLIWRENALERTRQQKLELIILLGGKCQICGFDDLSCVGVFDFHHSIPGKEQPITQILNFYRGSKKGYIKVKQEIKKCILLCANCHRKIHFR